MLSDVHTVIDVVGKCDAVSNELCPLCRHRNAISTAANQFCVRPLSVSAAPLSWIGMRHKSLIKAWQAVTCGS